MIPSKKGNSPARNGSPDREIRRITEGRAIVLATPILTPKETAAGSDYFVQVSWLNLPQWTAAASGGSCHLSGKARPKVERCAFEVRAGGCRPRVRSDQRRRDDDRSNSHRSTAPIQAQWKQSAGGVARSQRTSTSAKRFISHRQPPQAQDERLSPDTSRGAKLAESSSNIKWLPTHRR